MPLDDEACYRALAARDSRFDGLFFVGISSTGVYCRSVCSARSAKRSSCSFYESAVAAEKAGYRPCLICRPELAPGHSRVDATNRLASTAVLRIEDGALDEGSLEELAEELGVTDRHLRRAVVEHFGFSPIELAQTQRLLTAKRLLTDTDLSVGEVAFASGFSSVRRLNALFKDRYRLSPTKLRRRKTPTRDGSATCELGYRPPYDWEAMLSFLDARAIEGVELVRDGRYLRTVSDFSHTGWISVWPSPTKNALKVEVSAGLLPRLPQILKRVRRLFDTACEPLSVSESLGALAFAHPGMRVPGAFNGFELAVRAVLGQQVTVKAARTMAGRVAARFGEPIETSYLELRFTFPSAERIAVADPSELGEIGVIRTRSSAIVAIAQAVEAKQLRLAPGADPTQTTQVLTAMPGIGSWTAEYIGMRALSYPDAFPHSDLAVMKALNTMSPAVAKQAAESWRPWRAYAVMHLWKSLEERK